MRCGGAAVLVLALAVTAGAGEILFANGSRLDGELTNEVLIVSTGSGLLEVPPDQVAMLTRNEVHLQDGRVIRGTLVGGHLKAKTALGEVTIKIDELRAFRSGTAAAADAREPAKPTPRATAAEGPVTPEAAPVPRVTPGSGSASAEAPRAPENGLPAALPGGTPAPASAAPVPEPPTVSIRAASLTPPGGITSASQGRRLEVVAGASALYRDAYATASRIGRVVQGEHVMYLDSIDRRLRVLNTLIFDGGHWVKIRAANGTEGWVPADIVREAR